MLQEISVANCKRNPYLNIQEDAENVKRIVDSIKEIGLSCPIKIMENPEKQNEYIYAPLHKQRRIKKQLVDLWESLDSITARAYKLTKTQEQYFKSIGRNIDRNEILDNIL